ncbi:MAG: hypothetical protein TECD_00348 [Hyphomicrobiaceae bacterium hypho_1]
MEQHQLILPMRYILRLVFSLQEMFLMISLAVILPQALMLLSFLLYEESLILMMK